MKQHVNKVASSCFYHIRRLRQLRCYVDQQVMMRLVMSLVVSRLDYCNAVLAGLPASTIAPLQRVQNAAARLILGLDRRSHIKPALQRLHWLPVRFGIIYKIATLVYFVLHRRCPQYLLELITNDGDSGRRCLLSRTSRATIVQRTRTQLGQRAFSVCGPTIWNSLSKTLRLTDNQQFRRLLKTHLFNFN